MRRRHGMLVLIAAAVMAFASPVSAGQSWGPATPNFNLEAALRPVLDVQENGFGLVSFRQPKDADVIAYLDVWVRDLAPGHTYLIQRAVDTNVNDVCTGTNWPMPTLGQVTTDESGTGRAELSRSLAAIALGTEFDIHFRLIDPETSAVVLQSACYQFTVSQ
jgi:hypothetical protein